MQGKKEYTGNLRRCDNRTRPRATAHDGGAADVSPSPGARAARRAARLHGTKSTRITCMYAQEAMRITLSHTERTRITCSHRSNESNENHPHDRRTQKQRESPAYAHGNNYNYNNLSTDTEVMRIARTETTIIICAGIQKQRESRTQKQ